MDVKKRRKTTPVSQLEAIDQPTNLIEVSDKWISSDVMSSWSSSYNIVLSTAKSKSEKDLCKFLLRSLTQMPLRLFVRLWTHSFFSRCLSRLFISVTQSFHFLRFNLPCTRHSTTKTKERKKMFLFFMCDICCIAIIFYVILICFHNSPQTRCEKSFWLLDNCYHHLYVEKLKLI